MKKIRIKNPDGRIVTIYTSKNQIEAELVRNTLLDHDIECHLDGEFQAGFAGVPDVDIVVKESDVEFAAEVIEKHHPHLIGENATDETD